MAPKALIDHVVMYVKDVKKCRAFYEPILALLGAEVKWDREDDGYVCFATPGVPTRFIIAGGPNTRVGKNHVAFKADSEDVVQRFHELALKLGGEDYGKPGIRENYAPDYYAAFVLDPEGNNVELVKWPSED
ncbi:Glyoxalase/Bleomycin resistance protein/Dihydroxybiphenyl dioxygenase [Lipomyces tetrasporus]|uniref:Glyoxalase/Bleomycin resistance protein/Dihydroxybiphenyl dioxygenase n=1 Tax=Lipomyces tetrasporus TaxID=54092 RepID=A0AAD7VS02_9ASCO|nr:Glyoxalase/Bleomycin resistance protein/Dihydroxybiphenyl dioxygenase [Lipomyces tetrasporus]KAJ8098620.1 Glyoxalase/Bleomycin resistance protein/Dihydroxybiphenyl dioxygenase [Lipomyces tetrasporus]